MLQMETDVMILAHHGADNGFTNKPFLANLKPSLAICSADYCNQYCMVFTLENGLIKLVNEYYCTILADDRILPLLADVEAQR